MAPFLSCTSSTPQSSFSSPQFLLLFLLFFSPSHFHNVPLTVSVQQMVGENMMGRPVREEGVTGKRKRVLEEGHAGQWVGHCLEKAPKRQSLRQFQAET